jgi:hypothetical protein
MGSGQVFRLAVAVVAVFCSPATGARVALAPLSQLSAPPSPSPITFNASMGSSMVLQSAPARACVYGLLGDGGTGATVAVSGTGTSAYKVQADITQGGWKACLQPTAVGGDVTITAVCTGCTNSTPAVIEHVTFGDVWYGAELGPRIDHMHAHARTDTPFVSVVCQLVMDTTRPSDDPHPFHTL